MTSTPIDTARAALRARQGAGARYDAPTAPAEDILLARRGTAFFARKLSELADDALFAPVNTGSETPAHVVARVSYAARLEALALEALTKGTVFVPPATLPSIALAATLPAHALRHLFHHSQVHLNVCWRDLPETLWNPGVTLHDGTPVQDLPKLRAIAIWHGAIALGNGARVEDIPQTVR